MLSIVRTVKDFTWAALRGLRSGGPRSAPQLECSIQYLGVLANHGDVLELVGLVHDHVKGLVEGRPVLVLQDEVLGPEIPI